jgi:16S rRNA (adenine1518-N6/adenine1519-N6)-dimethyltransferase
MCKIYTFVLMNVRAKKALGQHFLNDEGIALRIVDSLKVTSCGNETDSRSDVLEVGPGMGVLTKYLLHRGDISLKVVELDHESVEYLISEYPDLAPSIYEEDFLRMNLSKMFQGEFFLIGNFPYNISSQIFFKVLDYKEQIPQVVGMVQKEVAERLASPPGSKAYGILSVLLQAWYDIEYLFTVNENVFTPPPKVKSAVIRLRRNGRSVLNCDSEIFKKVIKTTFNQRRKTIRNSLKPLGLSLPPSIPSVNIKGEAINLLDMRPEQLSVEQFEMLGNALSKLC